MKHLERLLDTALVIVFILMIIISFLQVFFRYVLNSPLFASEEIARIFGVWLTFIGSALAVRYREHVSVDIVKIRVSAKLRNIFNLLSDVFLYIFHIFLVIEGAKLSYMFRKFESHALRFSMSFFFAAVPMTAFFILIFLTAAIREDILAIRRSAE